jgi:iron complex outermembrane receptor protein
LGALTIHPTDSFTYQEFNGFWSDELNFISTGDSNLQWVAGVYQFYQHYQQPVSAENLEQPQLFGTSGSAPAFGFCGTNPPSFGTCAPTFLGRYFDNRPDVQDQSYAGYGQIDWKFQPEWKLTLGVRYSYDRKYGTESIRLTCWFVCTGSTTNFDLTSDALVVASGRVPLSPAFPIATSTPAPLPTGVTGVTTYSTKYLGLATRGYNASWQSPSGTAGLEFTPDNDSLYYFKYGRGYKSGGYNIGIFTVLSFSPWTDAEHVDSFELGLKHTFGHFLTLNAAAYWYNYSKLQIPISITQTAGGLAQSQTSFYNVPKSISRGIELETTWTPIDHLTVLFNYSFSDAYITQGTAADPADPNVLEPGAKPILSPAACAASVGTSSPSACTADIFTASLVGNPAFPYAGLNVPQNLKGNPLPNAPRNKIAINVLYDFKTDNGVSLTPSVSYVWRDKQWGNFFKDPAWIAPAWGQWDARISVKSPNDKFEAIFFIKNIANTIGYDQGAQAFRAAGTNVALGGGPYVQGLNGPAGFNQHLVGADQFGVYQTLYVTPPRTWGVELHYKFY